MNERALKKLAQTLLAMSPEALGKARESGELQEVDDNAEETIENS